MNQNQLDNIFGLQCLREESKIVLIPAPWEVTTSYGSGTSQGPESILKASPQLDLYDYDFGRVYEAGLFMEPIDPKLQIMNSELKKLSQKVITDWDQTGTLSESSQTYLQGINEACEEMVGFVYNQTKKALDEGKFVGVIGGDHSTALGSIKAISEKYDSFGVLQFDAHADLRVSYQGFPHSHASIMMNVLNLEKAPERLVQVGIRDFCESEYQFIQANEKTIKCFFDRELKSELFKNVSWQGLCEKIISELPEKVYVSFDIDGLSPEFCPGTGTPVPGGLSYDQAIELLACLGRSGKDVVGFDLCEVSPSQNSEWDANVGARVLYKLCGLVAESNSLISKGH